jgi:hypothetical protein
MHSALWPRTVSSSKIHCILVMAVTVPALAGPTGETPVSSLEPNDLIGMSLDELPSQFRSDYELPLKAGLGMTSGRQGDRHFVLLFTRKRRGKAISKKIVSVLEIPHYDEKDEWWGFNFDCDSPGGEVRRGDAVVAIFEGRGYAPARLGWKVNVRAKTFEPVAGIRCYTFE